MYKLFGKWDMEEVEVTDPGIRRYVNIDPVIIPHTSGKHARQQFNKSEISIVERLINNMMRKENNTGKKQLTMRTVEDAFDIINQKTKKNPVQVLVEAIANAGPREEVVRLKYGGISVPKAVDTAPQRRIDNALRYISIGASQAAFKSKKTLAECLASELISASNHDAKCFSINRKDSKERVAKAAR
ncbi:30S ribosomal protein S7 [Methanosalsum natronophilum]|uniref:Small ribosomal subunit protein uS7 n=1 Tax=Methanosalsum natronophilum TaxID=768733 RepID=A0A3R7WF68_9EURY|nr:30S ribosomal protein S7 [Methanosalsum natronophilum]MCS3923020.1 small subunit ribosomal protein S7 [Methanosalsum natronophilum]RQD88975.1 MAG: 30S ribosomal protein S7 [Methanosalsum natronophilum]